ncbi:MAG: hypothetical protein HGJ94_03210 [Desulfosarcina sp.]|nr:hypothetical protein [Desulfosarcina sp.]MBC2743761.1 hypothetical protein [Desulfosarcina sp.]MBC2766670.1 hypothetical protein [Desulfosarcina sp.]
MKYRDLRYFCLALAFALCMAFVGCSGGSGNKLADISGIWKSGNDGTMIEINLAGEQNFLKIGDKTVEATAKNVQNDIISLDMKADNGQTEKWTLMQVWDDNGSTFSLAFSHNGTKDKLTLIKKL